MPGSPSLVSFLVAATQSAADALVAALDQLPPDRRDWEPAGTARSALDQFAECAILNGNTADLIQRRAGKPVSYGEDYTRLVAALREDETSARSLLIENTARAIAAIRSVPESELDDIIPLPWGTMTLQELIAFPYWNLTYHEGQIRYIASLAAPVPG